MSVWLVFRSRTFPLLSSSSSTFSCSTSVCRCAAKFHGKKSAKLFNVQTFDTNTNEIFIFAWCFCFFYFIFCLSLLYFCWFLCSVPWLLPVLCSRGGYNTQTHSFYCEKFKFIWVYSLEILTSAVHCCWCQALLTRCKYVCVCRVTMDWKINMSRV